MAVPENCFHCALPIPRNCDLRVCLEDVERPVCCPGCKAVAELIRDSGMSSYYAMRDAPLPGTGKPADDSNEWQTFDSDDMLRAFAHIGDNDCSVTVYAGGMYCSACSWLIETSLGKLDGVRGVDVNPVTHRVRVTFSPAKTGLGGILQAFSNLGYQPQPLLPDDTARPEVLEQRAALKRLLVASLGMMQVMMFAVGLYAGDFQGIDADMRRFLRFVSLFVTTPVVLYAARPFFAAAWRGIRARMPGMDLPVSVAIGAAYIASLYSTFADGAAVWFDSVTMFVFFLTLGRYLEMRARHRSIDRSAALSQLVPNTATLSQEGQRSIVPVTQLQRDDVIIVRAGDPVPADGIIVKGTTSVDEALLSGEANPQLRKHGDLLAAGSINLGSLVEMRVTVTGADTTLGTISRLSERARFARPAFVQLADRIASYIVVALLLVATAVAVFWANVEPERAFVITLSVLVVTCPCALALATPAAFATAASRLSQLQLLVTSGSAIETLSRATHFVFDKTGTLTRGRPELLATTVFDNDLSVTYCQQVAATLEQASSHPLAHAFRAIETSLQAENLSVHVGEGVSGTIGTDSWNIGSAAFAHYSRESEQSAGTIYLSRNGQCVAEFRIEDKLRDDAREVLQDLRAAGLATTIISGDNPAAVAKTAAALGVDNFEAGCTPRQKLQFIEALQKQGQHVVMVGDGINDAPVLAGANASIAPAHGALLAQTSADVIMLGESLRPLRTALGMSRKTMRIVHQNLIWAIVYNATALPLAVAGWVPPWLAAIGMSASSLVVVLNALRLSKYQ
ncbi:MAG: cadmium-translocating P-type ATPase [Gammaproteobacteria bacterium]|nr:cadmium-translocating P-type ATPase [Gammaproteobacteria bacterium]